jgi:hypothetical protein
VTELSRPIVALLASTFDASGPTERDDISRLRESLTVALRRCLDAPDSAWLELVDRGAVAGEWDEWRVASLVAAADPLNDPQPEVTRDALATLTEELIGRLDVLPGPWEGGARQAALASPRWLAGQARREIVFAIERAVVCLSELDADGLRECARRVRARDVDDTYPDLADALDACAEDADRGSLSTVAREHLRSALVATPFAAAVDRIG